MKDRNTTKDQKKRTTKFAQIIAIATGLRTTDGGRIRPKPIKERNKKK